MGTKEVKLERAGEKSAVDGSDLFVHLFIHHNIIHVTLGKGYILHKN